ncbi:MAG: exo-alpha-sialidase [Rubripirellula sp.]
MPLPLHQVLSFIAALTLWLTIMNSQSMAVPQEVSRQDVRSGAGIKDLAKEWRCDSLADQGLRVLGSATLVDGVRGKSLLLRDKSVLKTAAPAPLARSRVLSLSMWVNLHQPTGQQQILAAKNVYSSNHREWSLMVDRSGEICLYVYQDGWKSISSKVRPEPGHWYRVGFVLRQSTAELWVNDKITATLELNRVIPKTPAPITFGGVDDGGRIWQCFRGAIDEIRVFHESLTFETMAQIFYPVDRTHKVTVPSKAKLWVGDEIPSTADIEVLKDVSFRVIKRYEPEIDGYGFLHGVALCWHRGDLYASFGHNKGSENTLTEEGRFRVSKDGGTTWSPVTTIDAGLEKDNLAVSHGVFLSHQGKLWAFLGSFYGTREDVHTRAYTLDESSGRWQDHGTVVQDGFWPMTEPVKMENGNWVMPGFIVGRGNPPAVAVSDGDNLMSWNLKVIPVASHVLDHWGESSVWVSKNRLVNISRYGGRALALFSQSDDYGETWSEVTETNFPMTTSKPCCGTLSNGIRYLIASTSADGGGRRSPLTIALGDPNGMGFSRLYVIRHAIFESGPGESHTNASLAYPYATEHEGCLYVGYSNNGPRRANHNSAEMAVIPLSVLSLD